MFPQRDALIRLLRDDDEETVSLVKEQLASGGLKSLPDLQDLARTDDQRVAHHIAEVIDGLQGEEAVGVFGRFCRDFPDNGDVEKASWLLAEACLPGVRTKSFKIKLDAWGRQFSHLIVHAVSNRERVEALAQFMAGKLKFRGNSDDYYNPRNSLLPVVIETRSGIPITLSLLYILVAQRAGMLVEGVNLPGHFICRHGDMLFDPFHRGKILSATDCVEILLRQNLTINATHLARASNRDILVRVLANLLFIYERLEDCDAHQRVANWLAALNRSAGTTFKNTD